MPTDDDLLNSLGFLTGKVHSLIKKQVQFYLDEKGASLKMENYPAIRLLLHQDGLTQQSIADQIGFDRHRTSRMLDELETTGLISRTPHPDNRREKLIRLTENGQKARNVIDEAISTATQDALQSLTQLQSLELMKTLQIILQNLTN